MNADVMGKQLEIEAIFDDANLRFAQKTKVGGNVMMAVVMKDGKGNMTAQGQSMALPDEQLDAAKLGAFFIPELHFVDMGYDMKLDGVKDVEGSDAYKLIVTTPLGASITNYYSVESGLKLKSESAQLGDVTFSDYQAKEGVMIPMTQIIVSPAIPMPLEAKITTLELNPVLTDEDFK